MLSVDVFNAVIHHFSILMFQHQIPIMLIRYSLYSALATICSACQLHPSNQSSTKATIHSSVGNHSSVDNHSSTDNHSNTATYTKTDTIEFLAFGDGGYHMDYPKKKYIDHPKNPKEWVEAARKKWLKDHRPADEFQHAPLYVYPNTQITAELSGAGAVGQAMANYCHEQRCDFGIQLGDNIYPDGADADDGKDDQQRMDDLIAKPLAPLLQQNPTFKVYSSLGNHDWKSSRLGVKKELAWMQSHSNFELQNNGYYQFTQGKPGADVEFFVLDTNLLLSGQSLYEAPLNPDGSEIPHDIAQAKNLGEWDIPKDFEKPQHQEDKKQLAWLEKALASSTAKWKIVYGHHVLWSVGGTKYSEGHALRALLMPSLCQYADAYIAGHEHDLEMLTDDCSTYLPTGKKTPPLPLIISGAAAKMRGIHTPFAKQQELRYPQMDLLWAKGFTWGFAQITLHNSKEKMDVNFYSTPTDQSGKVIKESSFSFEHRSRN